MNAHNSSLLIIEPNRLLNQPYTFIPQTFTVTRVESVQAGLQAIAQHAPALILMSASFSMSQTLEILTAIKQKSTQQLIPIILVVDLSQKISSVPGTTWGDHIGILCSLSNSQELNSTFSRVLSV